MCYNLTEVRNSSIDSVCELALVSKEFANQCQDFLFDMFNDEIDSVRLNAINSLRKISRFVVVREDQLEIVLGVLKVFDQDTPNLMVYLVCFLFNALMMHFSDYVASVSDCARCCH